MDLPYRLESAIKKLYTAYHNNELIPECCKQCAVGNILDKSDSWKHLSDDHGSLKLNYIGKVHQNLGRTFNGYSPLELLQIETVFLSACGYQLPLHYRNDKPKNTNNKEVLFDGLMAVIKYLCDLDGVSNVLNNTTYLELENNNPKYKLEHGF
ncbi:Na(+)-translocating NADH-quinone reductase subunit F [Hwangdonia lutea]|uniref:Na(+)-translocating NADH-quinone reductase subunit F n=1 Tax=Hwangdonia lutea TaxID=3075823 RepID=A0AA97EJ14_9FLAO|nr:Na(+)-translocating NADH-quinone reductase subunit F [Hwangdonia sp. SCSIO 19198]WOD42344.1 Na(+)-translocating NADH-quinone reductase subunit F [Hwangdonia sp. SCSIO 19198]